MNQRWISNTSTIQKLSNHEFTRCNHAPLRLFVITVTEKRSEPLGIVGTSIAFTWRFWQLVLRTRTTTPGKMSLEKEIQDNRSLIRDDVKLAQNGGKKGLGEPWTWWIGSAPVQMSGCCLGAALSWFAWWAACGGWLFFIDPSFLLI